MKAKQLSHWVGGNRQCSEKSTNADQKSLETGFSIAICLQSGGQMAIKNSVSNNLQFFIYVCR